MKIDMHMHSSASPDGELRPAVLMKKAKKAGIELAALTDHDTIDGVNEILDNGYDRAYPNFFIPAIEMTVSKVSPCIESANGRMHILGYEIDRKSPELIRLLNLKAEYRKQNMKTYLQVLAEKFGITISDGKQERKIYSRVDIARFIAQKKDLDNLSTVYNKFIVPMDEFIKEKGYPLFGTTEEEVIKAIIAAGGYPTLAHAITLKLSDKELRKTISRLKEMGLAAIEIQHPQHSDEYRDYLLKIAEEYELLVTHGSDFHGEVKPEIMLGTGGPGNGHPLNSVDAEESSLAYEILPKRLKLRRK